MEAHNPLKRALSLSQSILKAIEDRDLNAVADLDSQRQIFIQDYYQSQRDIDAELTLALKEINDDIVARLVVMQQQTRAQQVELGRANKASHAFANLWIV